MCIRDRVNLRECVGDLVVREYALLLTLGYETLDLFQFVQFALKQIGFDSVDSFRTQADRTVSAPPDSQIVGCRDILEQS